MTIDSIVSEVTDQLTKPGAGRERVEKIDRLVEHLNERDLRAARALLRARPGISFSVNTTQARSDRLTISVRVQGVDCGYVVFEQPERIFRPSKTFKQHWKSDKLALEWHEPLVAKFLADCVRDADVRFAQREASIQEWLFRAMNGVGTKKTGYMRGVQPVLFGGVPIQIPSPVTPRGAPEKLGMGHSDLLARSRKRGRLVVFEVKRPDASSKECVGALAQAVMYAAALDYLMSRKEHRTAYWRLLGSRRGPHHEPSFQAVAFLNDAVDVRCEVALRAKLDELLDGNSSKYDLSVMLYRRTKGIEVVREMRGTN